MKKVLIILTGCLLLTACQWPLFSPPSAATADASLQAGTPYAEVPGQQATEENPQNSQPGAESYPQPSSSLSSPTPGSSYPAPENLLPSPTQGSSYPQPADLSQVSPSPTLTIDSSTQTPTGDTSTPQASLAATGTTETSDGAYPGSIPGGTLQPTQTSSGAGEAYPGPIPGGTLLPTQTSSGAGEAYPGSDLQATSTTISPPIAQTPANTATPDLTPTATPSPTFTPTPTPTQTPIPPPPWVLSQLVATDPESVILASGKVQLVEFFAFWCGPSQVMAPLVHGLEDMYGEEMNFIYLDIDDPATANLKKLLGYKTQPHFFLLNEYGVILEQWQGVVPVDLLIQAIESALK